MTADLFGTPELVPGFQYRADVLSPIEEDEMLGWLPNLPFRAFEFHGFEGKRRVVSFGWKYDFSLRPVTRGVRPGAPARQRLVWHRGRSAPATSGDRV